MARIIGIDFGTTSSVASVVRDGKPIIIPSAEGERFTPSIIGYDSDKKEIIVGAEARKRAEIFPLATIFSIKRFLGKKYRSAEIQQIDKTSPYKIQFNQWGGIVFDLGGKLYNPPQLASLLICKIKNDAEMYLSEKVDSAVLTVPAYFSDSQRQAVKEAATFAGLNVLRIINEPTAAALAYCYRKPQNQILVVLHFGGGTFDISVIDVGEGVFEVKATGGDTLIGGDDIDQQIVEWICNEVKKRDNVDLRLDRGCFQRLKWAAEKAKRELSTLQKTEICVPFLISQNGKYTDLRIDLDRRSLESLSSSIVTRIKGPCQQTLKDAGISPKDISSLLLTGQQTRMPMVQEAVRELFGMLPHKDVDPAEIVAMGAAILASTLEGIEKNILLLDVNPLTLSVETVGGVATHIIERNTTLPTYRTQTFSTTNDNQTVVDIKVLQGERPMACDNLLLGIVRLDGIPPAPKGIPQIEVVFDIDGNGILQVKATDKATGRTRSVKIIPPDEDLTVPYTARPPESKDEIPLEKIREFENLIGLKENKWSKIKKSLPAELDQLFAIRVQRTKNDITSNWTESDVTKNLNSVENIYLFGRRFLQEGLTIALIDPFIDDAVNEQNTKVIQPYIDVMKALDEKAFCERMMELLTEEKNGKRTGKIRKLLTHFSSEQVAEMLKPQTLKEKLQGKRKWAASKYGKE